MGGDLTNWKCKSPYYPLCVPHGLDIDRCIIADSAKCETSIEVSRRNLVKIKESFATLLKDVAGKLKTKELDLEMFHFFMVALFPPGMCIPQSSKVIEIFEAVTRNGLWSYWHYTPVEKIVAEYAPKDDEMKGWLDKYKKQLSGYKATTKIADAIKLYSIDELEEIDPSQRLTVTYDPAYLRQLSLKLNTRVTEKSLEYIDDLWVSLAEYFLLPSLSVLLDKIQSGCIEVSWLIPPHYAFQIIGNLQENSSYLQLKGIIKVLLDGDCIYDVAQNEECKQVHVYNSITQQKQVSHIKLMWVASVACTTCPTIVHII